MENIYNMTIPIYENKIPKVYENVLVIFTEHKETHIEARLLEYENINGMMVYGDATRKKKVYDWKKEVPLNKPTIAQIEQIINNKYVQISTLCFIDKKKDPKELATELMQPFNDNKILVNIMKKLCKNLDIDFNNFWINIMYKIDNERKKENYYESLLNIFNNDIELVKSVVNDELLYDKIMSELNKLMNNKITKLQTKINLVTKKDINNTIKLIDFIKLKNEWLDSIKYESGSNYIFESSSEISTENNHTELIELIKNHGTEYNVEVKII
jgi:hypothetical protein